MEEKKQNNHQVEEVDWRSINEAERMGVAPVGRLLASMAWPAILSMLINGLYNIVDSIFVAQVSQKALTAVSLVMPMQLLMLSFMIGSGIGVNSLISRRLGEKNQEAADSAASMSPRIGLMNFIPFLLCGLFLTAPFMRHYTDDPVIYGYGVSYMRIVLCFSLFNALEIPLEKVFQATGNMKAPMFCLITGCVTNTILDPIFIFGWFGMPRMEVTGAAIATVLGQLASLIVAVFILNRQEHAVRVRIRGYQMDFKILKEIYEVGFPGIVMQAIGSFMLIAYNTILAAEPVAVAVMGIYFKIQSFVFMPVFGLNQGAMPLIGYNYGARNKKRLMHTFKLSLLVAVLIMATGTVILRTFPEVFLYMFNAKADMIAIGVPALRIISLCFVPAAFGIMCSTVFQATGHGFYSLFGSLIRQFFGILPAALILYRIGGVTLSWYSFPLAEIVGTLYVGIMFRHLYKSEIRDLDIRPARIA